MTKLWLAGLLLLSACDDIKIASRSDEDRTRELEREVSDIKFQQGALRRDVESARAMDDATFDYAKAVGNEVDSLRNVVNGNAKIYNEHLKQQR